MSIRNTSIYQRVRPALLQEFRATLILTLASSTSKANLLWVHILLSTVIWSALCFYCLFRKCVYNSFWRRSILWFKSRKNKVYTHRRLSPLNRERSLSCHTWCGIQLVLNTWCGIQLVLNTWCDIQLVLNTWCGIQLVLNTWCDIQLVLNTWCDIQLVLNTWCDIQLVLNINFRKIIKT